MSKLDVLEIVPRLIEEFDYPPRAADSAAQRLVAANPQVQGAFLHWWNTGEIAELEVEGYTVQRLVDERSMKIVAAYLTLDWLMRDPEAALAFLAKGYDWIE